MTLEDDIKKWNKIHKIIDFHKTNFKSQLNFKSASALHYFHTDINDYNEVLQRDNEFRKQSFRWPSKDDKELDKICDEIDDSENPESGSEKTDDFEFENRLFSNDIGEAIHKHNSRMSRIKSSENRKVYFSCENNTEEEKLSLAVDSTLDTNLMDYNNKSLEVPESRPQISQQVEDFKNELSTDPHNFESIQQQFMNSKKSPRN